MASAKYSPSSSEKIICSSNLIANDAIFVPVSEYVLFKLRKISCVDPRALGLGETIVTNKSNARSNVH